MRSLKLKTKELGMRKMNVLAGAVLALTMSNFAWAEVGVFVTGSQVENEANLEANRICGNPPATRVSEIRGTRCANGARVVGEFRNRVRFMGGDIQDALQSAILAAPPSMREAFRGCMRQDAYGPTENVEVASIQCMKRVVTHPSPELQARLRNDGMLSSFNRPQLLGYIERAGGTQIARGVYRSWCARSQGNVSSTGALRQQAAGGSNLQACVQETVPQLFAQAYAYAGVEDRSFSQCPPHLSNVTCRGGRFDLNQRSAQQRAGVNVQTGTPQDQIADLTERMTPVFENQFEADLADYALDRYVESYLTTALLDVPRREGITNEQALASFEAESNALKQVLESGSCRESFGNRRRASYDRLMQRLRREFTSSNGALNTARDFHRNQMALAGVCMDAIESRLGELSRRMGLGTVQATSLLSQEELAQMGWGARTAYGLANFVPGVGAAQVVAERTPVLSGMTDAARTACNAFGYAPNSPECRQVRAEYDLLSAERDALYQQFTALREPVGSQRRPMYRVIAERSGNTEGGARRRLGSYRMEFSGPNALGSCMARFQRNPDQPTIENLERVDAGALEATQDALNHVRTTQLGVDPTTGRARAEVPASSVLGRIRNLCENKEDFALEMVRNPTVMDSYFSCQRAGMGQAIEASLGQQRQNEANISSRECRDRRSAGWIACQLHRRVANRERNVRMAQDVVMLGFDGLRTLPAAGALSGSLSRATAGEGLRMSRVALGARVMGVQGLVGAGIGTGIAGGMELAAGGTAPAEGSVGDARAGMATAEQFDQGMAALRAANRPGTLSPMQQAALDGFIGGALGGLFFSGSDDAIREALRRNMGDHDFRTNLATFSRNLDDLINNPATSPTRRENAIRLKARIGEISERLLAQERGATGNATRTAASSADAPITPQLVASTADVDQAMRSLSGRPPRGISGSRDPLRIARMSTEEQQPVRHQLEESMGALQRDGLDAQGLARQIHRNPRGSRDVRRALGLRDDQRLSPQERIILAEIEMRAQRLHIPNAEVTRRLRAAACSSCPDLCRTGGAGPGASLNLDGKGETLASCALRR